MIITVSTAPIYNFFNNQFQKLRIKNRASLVAQR